MFRGRGSSPSIGGGGIGGFGGHGESDGMNDNSTVSHHHPYIRYWRRYRYYYYDRNFLIMEMIAIILIVAVCVIAYVLTYKPTFADPIETIKKTYINSQLIALLVSASLIGLASFLSKTKETLIKHLKIILLLSVITIMVFLGIKLSLNNTYNADKFAEFYETSDLKKEEKSNKQNISIGLSGMKITDFKQTYIDENVKAYNFFSVKAISCIVLYVLIVAFNIFMIIRIMNFQVKADRLSKDDAILYDDEQNIKF